MNLHWKREFCMPAKRLKPNCEYSIPKIQMLSASHLFERRPLLQIVQWIRKFCVPTRRLKKHVLYANQALETEFWSLKQYENANDYSRVAVRMQILYASQPLETIFWFLNHSENANFECQSTASTAPFSIHSLWKSKCCMSAKRLTRKFD